MRLRGHLSRALANTGSFADLSENPVARNTKKSEHCKEQKGLQPTALLGIAVEVPYLTLSQQAVA